MLRFLKWIFFIFGGLALGIMIFFYSQNKKDIHLALDYKDILDHEYLSQNCPQTKELKSNYLYPCFKTYYDEMLEKAGLTGVSIGLKLAFNFMDEDKEKQKLFEKKEADIVYSLHYLELNNKAIDECDERFNGFKMMYGGYLSSLRDFLRGAKDFNDGLILGLEGDEGIESLETEDKRILYSEKLNRLKAQYEQIYQEVHERNEAKINELLAKNDQK